MKNLLILLIAILFLISCRKPEITTMFDSSEPLRTYVGGKIEIKGMDLDVDKFFTATIGNSDMIEVDYISGNTLEITVPEWAKSGELVISGSGIDFSVGQVLIARLFMVDDLRHIIREHAIGTGYTLREVKDFGDWKVDQMIYSRNSDEIVASVREGQLSGQQYFYKYNLADATEVLVEFDAKNIAFDDEGTLYGTIGSELAILSLENGSKISTVASFDAAPKSIDFFQSDGTIRGTFEEVFGGGYTANYEQKIELATASVSNKSEQEFTYFEVKAANDGSYYASVQYKGVLEFSNLNSITDYPLNSSDDCCTNVDYSDDWNLLIFSASENDNNGIINRRLHIHNTKTEVKTEFNEWGRQLVIIDPK